MIQWILVILVWFLIPIIHKQLLKLTWYRWLVNSMLYPITKVRLKKRYLKMTEKQRIESWTNYETMDHWAKDYWFSKKLSEYILLTFIDN